MSVEALTWANSVKTGSSSRKSVLRALANFADENGSCFPGHQKLADHTEYHINTIGKVLNELEKLGFLKREHRNRANGSRTSDRYFLPTTTVVRPDTLPTTEEEPTHTDDGARKGEPLLKLSEEPKKETTSPKILNADFEEWWALYPHKVGKHAAKQKYEIARRTASPWKLQSGVQRYIRDKPADRPWCNPATWLHQGRWKDEPAPATGRRGWGETAKAMIDEERNPETGGIFDEQPALPPPERV